MSDQAELLPQRRVIAAHNEAGIGSVTSDINVVTKELEFSPETRTGPLWKITDPLPTKDNNKSEDGATRPTPVSEGFGLVPANGSSFQTTELAPGGLTPMHRTSSIDYDILLTGEIILIMEDGSETHLKNAGDVVVMKGAMHAWKNPSTTKWCRLVTVLTAAEPTVVQGKVLEEKIV
ncbi:hypothetical protein E1B28_002128 [Marasmius oreades]|uniref:Uncharacterized protein n=1 Tax=Marasmius oreades TaxID=181124 RepID=A0A9P7RM99_9AGAR|nr:uncharacterized protein E1B28_002128 [Marasmius oreades]KAG7086169.1 hypothetical protein E1B28_002128 [Marasmius oreades]